MGGPAVLGPRVACAESRYEIRGAARAMKPLIRRSSRAGERPVAGLAQGAVNQADTHPSRPWRSATPRIGGAYLAQAVHERAAANGRRRNRRFHKALRARLMTLTTPTFSLGS